MVAAVRCFEVMISIESLLGVRSERLANAYTDLSLCYSAQSRMPEAMQAQEKAIDMQRELTGPSNPLVLVLTANLAVYKSKAKDYVGAQKLLKELLVQAEQRVPPNAYSVGFVLNALVDSYMAQEHWAEAEEAARRLASVDDTLLAQGLYPFGGSASLAELYARTGRFAEAELAARSAVALTPVKDRAVTVPGHEILGKVLIAEGRPLEAKKEFDQALALLTEKYGDCERTQYWRARHEHLLKLTNPFQE
jgi:tetratricopeptide (TPR) repeat protein